MSKQSMINTTVLNGGVSETIDINTPPAGVELVINLFGAGDIKLADDKSTVYGLMWDGQFVPGAMFSLTGNTRDAHIKEGFVGDGTKKLQVYRKNYSADDKICPFWIVGYYRE